MQEQQQRLAVAGLMVSLCKQTKNRKEKKQLVTKPGADQFLIAGVLQPSDARFRSERALPP